MKKIILLLVLAFGFVFTSCEKDNAEPAETPTTQTTSGNETYDRFIVISTPPIETGEVIFTNITTNQSETISPVMSDTLCSGEPYTIMTYPLSLSINVGDSCKAIISHDNNPILLYKPLMGNSSTNLCNEWNGTVQFETYYETEVRFKVFE